MEPKVRYAKTSDGISIAFWTLGEGRPLVYMPGGPWNHLDMWDVPECRRWFEALAAKRMLVRYDNRGTGHSQRDVTDFSLEAQLLDLEATLDAVGVDELDMFAGAGAGPVALTFAARHAARVGQLVLWCSWVAARYANSPRIRAWLRLLEEDWDLMTDTCAHLVMGWSGGKAGRRAAEQLRESVSPEVARAALTAIHKYDASEVLPQVRASTLVLHRSDISWLSLDTSRQLAAGIQGARLTVLDGESAAPYVGDVDRAIDAVTEFLGGPSADSNGELAPIEA